MTSTAGPLAGLKVIELAGLGAGPFAGMLLSDFGAEVIRVDRVTDARADAPLPQDFLLGRGRRSIAIDLKNAEGAALALDLIARSDALIEGFRPGVMERLGLGPSVCLARNPRLVYGRATGWGQDGPYAHTAGHDLNYIAIAGALDPIGRFGGPPVPPLNLIGDFAGGGVLLAFGIAIALLEASRSKAGQVVDAAMVDGSALLMTMFHGLRAKGVWVDARGSNFNDSGAPYYDVYATADGRYVSVAAIEPKFYAQLLELIGLGEEELPAQDDRSQWPAMKERFARAFRQKTLAEWCDILEGSDACFAPVLPFYLAPEHPHNAHRGTFQEVAGMVQPAPAPRLNRTPGLIQGPPPRVGQHTDEVLAECGIDARMTTELRANGVIA